MGERPTVRSDAHRVPMRTLIVEVVEGPDAGRQATASSDRVSIGAADDNDLVLRDPTVSRYHLELEHLGDHIRVHDLGSTNGTTFGGARLKDAEVVAGATLRLGGTAIRIRDGATQDVEVHRSDRLGGVIGRSPSMRTLMALVEKVARSRASVLLHGETGAGKEVIAEQIHAESERAGQPFEIVDCGSLSPMLVAGELFGHQRGAYTGADRDRAGAFERANGGTVFLDEIGELPSALQTNLLGVLERGSVRRVGGDESIDVDVRIVCATHRDLRAEVNSGRFRQDLYYRIAVVRMNIPPLRKRTEDIPLLVDHFLKSAGETRPMDEVIPPNVIAELMKHRWEGNVRELRNFVDAAIAIGEVPPLDPDHWDESKTDDGLTGAAPSADLLRPFKDARLAALRTFERAYLSALLERSEQNVTQAAREAGLNRSYLNEMLKRHGFR